MRIQKKSLEKLIKQYNSGNILYRFNIAGKVYIGQSRVGYRRIYNHLATSYYYEKGTGEIKDFVPGKNGLYNDLRRVSGKTLDLSYLNTNGFGLDDKFTPFLAFFRPIDASGKIYQYNNVNSSPTYQMDLGELLYIYYEQAQYNMQCGSQHNIAEIAFNKGKVDIGNRILITYGGTGTTVQEARAILDNPKKNSDKILEDLKNNLQINTKGILEEIATCFLENIKNGVLKTQNTSSFKKEIKELIEKEVAKQITIYKNNLKETKIFDTCSRKVENGQLKHEIKWNDNILNKLLNLRNTIVAASKKTGKITIPISSGPIGSLKIDYSLSKEDIKAIDDMDVALKNIGQTRTPFNGFQVEEDFRKKMVALRFIDAGYKVRKRVGSQLTGSDNIFHTRPKRMKYSELEGGHELPEYAFVFNSNPDIRKSEMYDELTKIAGVPSDSGDLYYHILMSIADSENNLEFIRRLPLTKRQKGTRRKQYSIYIYKETPSGVPSSSLPTDAELPVHGAYAMSGDETGIQSGLNDTIDLSNLTDY